MTQQRYQPGEAEAQAGRALAAGDEGPALRLLAAELHRLAAFTRCHADQASAALRDASTLLGLSGACPERERPAQPPSSTPVGRLRSASSRLRALIGRFGCEPTNGPKRGASGEAAGNP